MSCLNFGLQAYSLLEVQGAAALATRETEQQYDLIWLWAQEFWQLKSLSRV